MTHPKLKGVEPQGIRGKSPVILLRLVLIFFHQRRQDENLGRFVPSYHCFLWLVVKAVDKQELYPQTTGRKKIGGKSKDSPCEHMKGILRDRELCSEQREGSAQVQVEHRVHLIDTKRRAERELWQSEESHASIRQD